MSVSIAKLGDCMDFMREMPDNFADLAIVDPPYGLGSRLSDGGGKLKNTPMAKLYRESSQWDIIPDQSYFDELFRVSKNQIICGGNYFNLPPSRGFIIWDKIQRMHTLSHCEYIWISFDCPAKIYSQMSTDYNRFHPTQKPIDLYKFLLTNYANKDDKILDTHLGSGSSRIACYDMGFDFYGYELDKDYFEAQEKRYKDHISQERLFVPQKEIIQDTELFP